MKIETNHTFVICAYKESCYLETCIRSLLTQSIRSNILMVTSTENEYLHLLSKKYKIPLLIHEQNGIGADWNFGIKSANTSLVTLVHQDDVYLKHYLAEVINAFSKNRNTSVVFSNYREIRNDVFCKSNVNIKIKECLLLPIQLLPYKKSLMKMVLALGNPICCPSVTYNLDKMGKIEFDTSMKTNMDWLMWKKLAMASEEFTYLSEPLVGHRIHDESTTSNTIEDNIRRKEDLLMLKQFWPEPIANLLGFFYHFSEFGNK